MTLILIKCFQQSKNINSEWNKKQYIYSHVWVMVQNKMFKNMKDKQ